MGFDWRDPYGYMQGYMQQPYSPFQQQQAPAYPQNQPRINMNKIFVNGLEGAKALQVPNNACMLACDNDLDVLYEITTDGTGKRSIRVFDISEHKEEAKPSYVTEATFAEFKDEVQAFMKGLKKETE